VYLKEARIRSLQSHTFCKKKAEEEEKEKSERSTIFYIRQRWVENSSHFFYSVLHQSAAKPLE
jgi:hypothetical protein